MPTKSWKEIRANKLSPAARARVEGEVRDAIAAMDLREARESVGKTQAEVSKETDMSQGEISRLERRDDLLLSTLRRYVAALGGELQLVAKFRDKAVLLRPSAEE
jgi:transcriptional regulator with XRE-family HTH domain